MKGIRISKSIEVFFVILIILGLCISAVVLMDAGKKAYEKIIDNNSQLENARIALSYLGMRLRQNNTEGAVQFISGGIEGADTIKLVHSGDFEGMVTYIYFSNGELKELFTWADGEPDPDFSETIVSLDGLDIKKGKGYFEFTAHYSEDGYPKRLGQIIGILGK
jgi:hypothetical protein